MLHDMIKLQLSPHFCRVTKIFCRVTGVSCCIRVTLYCDFYTFRSCNTCSFSLPTFQGGHKPGKHGKSGRLREFEKLSKSQGKLRES